MKNKSDISGAFEKCVKRVSKSYLTKCNHCKMFMTCFPLVFFPSLFFYFDRNIIHENRFVKNFFACTKCCSAQQHVRSVSFLFSCNILCHSRFLHRLKFSTSAKLFKARNIQFTCRDNKVCSIFFRRVKFFFRCFVNGGGKQIIFGVHKLREKLVKEIIDLQC